MFTQTKLRKGAAAVMVSAMVWFAAGCKKSSPTEAVVNTPVNTQVPSLVQAAVNLRTAGNFAILSKTGITTTGATSVVGDMGVSPIAAAAMTGFGLVMDSSNAFSTSSLVTGSIYAADYTPPTPAMLTTAVSDMQTAFTDAAGRTNPRSTELGAGDISGMTLAPGLYKWSSGVLITSGVTLNGQGNANAVFIFQIAQNLTVANAATVTLTGGTQAKNVFWQVSGQATLGTTSAFKGIILSQTAIVMQTGAALDGRALAQTAVTLDANAVTAPSVVPVLTATFTPTVVVPTNTPTVPVPTDTPTLVVPTNTPTVPVPTDTPTVVVPTNTPTVVIPTFTATYSPTATAAVGQAVVNLGTAADFVILSKTGITTTGTTSVLGDIGVSPIAATAMTGFDLIMDSSNEFSTSSLVTGNVYAADYLPPTPAKMTAAVSDMQTAFSDAAGRSNPDATELGAGDISGMTLAPGLYKWSSGVLITNGVTLDGQGDPNAVYIFQIAQDLTVANDAIVTLSGNAQARNVFWQVSGQAVFGTTSVVKGQILSQTAIVMQTGATLDGRALAQTAVTLDANGVTKSN